MAACTHRWLLRSFEEQPQVRDLPRTSSSSQSSSSALMHACNCRPRRDVTSRDEQRQQPKELQVFAPRHSDSKPGCIKTTAPSPI